MFKAHIMVIFANLWFIPIESVGAFENEADCYAMMMHQIQSLPQELVDSGFGVQSMECNWTPPPPRERPTPRTGSQLQGNKWRERSGKQPTPPKVSSSTSINTMLVRKQWGNAKIAIMAGLNCYTSKTSSHMNSGKIN